MTQTPTPMPPAPAPAPGGYGPAQRAVGLAIAALILGLCGFIPFLGFACGLVGILLAAIALAKKTTSGGLAIGGLITGILGIGMNVALLALLVSVLMPSLAGARERARRAACMANLNGIGMAAILYQGNHDDEWPPDLDTLLQEGNISRKMLKCPSAKAGRDCDYFYMPPVLDNAAEGETLIACDYKDNHPGNIRIVLYAALNVGKRTEAQFQTELAHPRNAEFAAALRAAEGP